MVQFRVEEEADIILMVCFTFNACEMEKSLMTFHIYLYWVSLAKNISEEPDKRKFLCGVLEAGSCHAWGF